MEARGEIGVTLPREWVKHGHLIQWAVRDLAAVLWQRTEAGPVVLAQGVVLTQYRLRITEETHSEAGALLRWAWRTYWD